MTAAGDALNQVVPTLVRLARRPGGVLLVAAGLGVGAFALLGLVWALTTPGGGRWIPLVLAGFLAVPVVVLTVRRARLQARTEGLDVRRTVGAGGTSEVVVRDGEPVGLQREMDTLSAAAAESTLRTARFLPRLEAAQRAAVVAAGGVVHAPYLRDDLRVTVVALLGTIVAIPLAGVGSLVTAVALIAR